MRQAVFITCLIVLGVMPLFGQTPTPEASQLSTQHVRYGSEVIWFIPNKFTLTRTACRQLDALARLIPQDGKFIVVIDVQVIRKTQAERRYSFSVEQARADEIKRYLYYQKEIDLYRVKEQFTSKVDPQAPRSERDTIKVEIWSGPPETSLPSPPVTPTPDH
ncbi:MAG: hypothetical protein HY774_02060 [Acidobacteria bacterium]|nr:hypothetical protein [Acidobacteriota bacterium]